MRPDRPAALHQILHCSLVLASIEEGGAGPAFAIVVCVAHRGYGYCAQISYVVVRCLPAGRQSVPIGQEEHLSQIPELEDFRDYVTTKTPRSRTLDGCVVLGRCLSL